MYTVAVNGPSFGAFGDINNAVVMLVQRKSREKKWYKLVDISARVWVELIKNSHSNWWIKPGREASHGRPGMRRICRYIGEFFKWRF